MKTTTLALRFFLLVSMLITANCAAIKKRGEGKKEPEVTNAIPITHFSHLDTCRPTLSWKAVTLPNSPVVTYDVVVYEARKASGKLFRMGSGIFYREGYPSTQVQLDRTLPEETPYFWSIRVRTPEGKVSQWSTKSKSVNNPAGTPEYDDRWHGFVTAEKCN